VSGGVAAPQQSQPAEPPAREERGDVAPKDDATPEPKQLKEAPTADADDRPASDDVQVASPNDEKAKVLAPSKPAPRAAAEPAAPPPAPEGSAGAVSGGSMAARAQVVRVDNTVARVVDVVGELGGRVVGSPSYGTTADGRTATVTIEVPASKVASASGRIRGIAGVTNVSPSLRRARNEEQERDKVAKKSADVELVTVTVSIRGQ
jgi:hypothetical protein